MNIIEINKLNVFYGQNCALSDIQLHIPDKDFLAIIGPNGGGKSTLLKSMLGLISPASGSIKILGTIAEKAAGNIGYVPQYSQFNRNFPANVLDVVVMGRLANNPSLLYRYQQADFEIALNCMRQLEIEHLQNQQVGNLSGGQIQRVLIARALAMQPRILLLDEPTASVDSTSKTHIYSLLEKLNQELTIVIVTHDIGAISSYVKHIACLNKTLYYHGDTELNDSLLQKVYGCPVDLIAHGVPHRILRAHPIINGQQGGQP